jgi:hypothetical protein
VDYLLCQQLVDSELGIKRKSNNDGKGFRLDRLLNHIQGCHKDFLWMIAPAPCSMPDFSQAGVGANGHSDGPTSIGTHDGRGVGAAAAPPAAPGAAISATRGASPVAKAPTKMGSSFLILAASTEIDNVETGEQFWRRFRQNLDTIIKANAAAQVIPCAETIAEEVMRQKQLQQREYIRTSASREHWRLHDNEADMAMDDGLAYETIDDDGRTICCPICKDFGDAQ